MGRARSASGERGAAGCSRCIPMGQARCHGHKDKTAGLITAAFTQQRSSGLAAGMRCASLSMLYRTHVRAPRLLVSYPRPESGEKYQAT